MQICRSALIQLRPNTVTERATQLNRTLRSGAAVEGADRAAHASKMRLGEIIQLSYNAFATFPLHPGRNPEE